MIKRIKALNRVHQLPTIKNKYWQIGINLLNPVNLLSKNGNRNGLKIFKRCREHLKRSNDKTKAQLQEANENMVNFFDNTQKQVSVFFNKVNLDLQAKSQESREKFIEGLQGINQNWSTFVNKQQKEFEKSMGGWNKWVWKAQLQFVFWLIPIVILFLVILGLIRTFLPGLIPGL